MKYIVYLTNFGNVLFTGSQQIGFVHTLLDALSLICIFLCGNE